MFWKYSTINDCEAVLFISHHSSKIEKISIGLRQLSSLQPDDEFMDQWTRSQPGIILCICPANGKWCYIVMLPLIGWAHTQNEPCTTDRDNNFMPVHCHIITWIWCWLIVHQTPRKQIRRKLNQNTLIRIQYNTMQLYHHIICKYVFCHAVIYNSIVCYFQQWQCQWLNIDVLC